MTATMELLKNLRTETGAGVLACRRALESAGGSFELALADLRRQAAVEAERRAGRAAAQGHIRLYSHAGGRIGVMVEINTETDFASRSPVVQELGREIALQIAAEAPAYVRDEDIPAEVLARETRKAEMWARSQGKPEALIARISAGYCKKFMDRQVLLRQVYIRDDRITIAQLVSQAASSAGENVQVRRFVRWEVAEGESVGSPDELAPGS